MSKQTLYKAGWVSYGENPTRVIDTNELVQKKMEHFKASIPGETSKFAEQDVMAEDVARLLADDETEGKGGFSEGIPAKEIEISMEEAEHILENARMEAEQILENARMEAENIKKTAFTQGQETGKQNGYELGRNEAMMEFASMKDELARKEQELEQSYYNKVEQIEPMLIDTLCGIYEHVFQVDLKSKEDLIAHLASNTIRQIDMSRDFIVHVSREDYENTKVLKETLLAACVAANATVEVIEDFALKQGECLIETDGGIYDCSLGVQLDGLRKELQLLSYVKGE